MGMSLDEFIERASSMGLVQPGDCDPFQTAVGESVSQLLEHLVAAQKLTTFQRDTIVKSGVEHLSFGEYVLIEQIGIGGMGVVYKARHRRMKRVAALKVLPQESMRSPAAVHRFYREAEAAARLTHPNIVTAYDAGEARGTHFLVMEHVDGGDLSTIIRQRGRLPIPEAVDYVTQAARGLAYAHQAGVIHRDIKPSNMLLSRDGTVKLLDMGLALLHEEDGHRPEISITGEGRLLGTAEYMAPEQAVHAHDADHRSDIYSLGCTLYRLISGATPYSGRSTMEMVLAHREKPIRMLRDAAPEAPEALEAVYIQMVAKRPEDRFQSMEDVVFALEELIATGRVPRFERPKSPSRGDVSMASSSAVPIARSKRKKDAEPHAEARPSPPSMPAVTQYTTQASEEDEVVAVVDASQDGGPSLSETTSGAEAMLIDAMSMAGSTAARSGATKSAAAHRGATSRAGTPRRRWPVAAVAAVALIAIIAFAMTGGPTPEDPTKDAVTPIGTDGAKDAATKDSGGKDSTSVTPVANKEEWLDLLALIDVTKDRVAGNWRKDSGGGITGGVGGNERIAAPALISGNYKLIVKAKWNPANDRNGEGTIVFPVGNRPAALTLNGYGDHLNGIALVRGETPSRPSNPTRSNWFRPDPPKVHEIVLTVRTAAERASIVATVDGQPLVDWSGPTRDINLHEAWLMPSPSMIGFVTWTTSAVILEAKLSMLDGGAATLLRAPPAEVKPPSFVRFREVAPTTEPIDLLAACDPALDARLGKWRRDAQGLTAFADARNQILASVEVTGDYDLSVTVQPFAGNRFTATLPVGESHATFHFVRGVSSALIGFEVIDGKPFHMQGNPSYAARSDIDFRAPLLFDFSVRLKGENANLVAKIGGRQVSAWQGPVSALSLHADWKITQQGRRIQLGANLDPSTTLTISKATLNPIGGAVIERGQETPSELDLVALSDPTKDTTFGTFRKTSAGLIGEGVTEGATTHKLSPPVVFPTDYELEATIGPMKGEQAVLTFPVGATHATINLTKQPNSVLNSGLEMIDGLYFSMKENPTRVEKPGFDFTKPHTLTVSVQSSGNEFEIAAKLDGQPLLKWKGPASALSTHPRWITTKRGQLSLGTSTHSVNSPITFERLVLRTRGAPARMLRPPVTSEWVDLMPLIDVALDGKRGQWTQATGEIVASEGTGRKFAVLPPVEISGDYDVQWSVKSGEGCQAAMVLPVGSSYTTFVFNADTAKGPMFAGLDELDGLSFRLRTNPTFTDLSDRKINLHVPQRFEASVRVTGADASIAVRLNDLPVFDWKGPISRLRTSHWATKDTNRLHLSAQLLANSGKVTYSAARVRLVNGTPKLLRPDRESVKLTITKTKEFAAGGGMVEGLALTGGGTFLISSTFDKSVRAWDLKHASPTSTKLAEVDRCHMVVMSPDDQFVAAACNSKFAYVYNAGKSDPLVHRLGPLVEFVWGVAFTDKTTLVGNGRDGVLMAWDLAASPVMSKQFGQHGSECMGVHVSRDRKLLASCGGNATMGNVKVWDAKTGELKREIKDHKAMVHAVDFVQPAGKNKQVITASHHFTLKLFDAITGDFIRQFNGHNGQVWNVVVHPSDRAAFSCGSDGMVRAWDLETGLELWSEKLGSGGGVHGLALSGDGKVLAAGAHDGKVRIYAVDVAASPAGR